MASEQHRIFTVDPEQWMKYVYKHVRIETASGHVQGVVYTVDPVSECMAVVAGLHTPQVTVTLVLPHAITGLELQDECSAEDKQQLDTLCLEPLTECDEAELAERKQKVRTWLEQNRIPVETGDTNPNSPLVLLGGAAVLEAPYQPEQCRSNNPVVVDRLHRLLQQLS